MDSIVDSIEKEYLSLIDHYTRSGDSDEAYNLNLGLQQYRLYYKVRD